MLQSTTNDDHTHYTLRPKKKNEYRNVYRHLELLISRLFCTFFHLLFSGWEEPDNNNKCLAELGEWYSSIYFQIRGRKSNLFSSVTIFYKNIHILFGDVVCEIDWDQEWTDSNLKWNSSEYGNVEDIRMPPSALWKPDILMYNRCR